MKYLRNKNYLYLPHQDTSMVLEDIINPVKAERQPAELLLVGAIYCCVALLLGWWVFREFGSALSMITVFLTVMACIPLIHNTIKVEEEKDLVAAGERSLLKEHGRAISAFLFLFLGIMVVFALAYLLLPESATNTLFSEQSKTITRINGRVTAETAQNFNFFIKILLNNFNVMWFCLLFSFLYGAGAIFILTWNASVIGAAIGNFIRSHVSNTASYFYMAPLGVLRYMVHGIPEIVAYLVAGLAGGIISVAIINHDFRSSKFDKVVLDAISLFLVAVALVFIAAAIEVYITPLLF